MAITGINGYSNYQYQNTLNLLRLSSTANSSKAIEAIKKLSSTSSSSSSSTSSAKKTFASTTDFLTSYQSELTALESVAAKLSSSSSKNVFTDFQAASTDEGVATVKGNWRLNGDTDITLNVQSMAQAQKNVSKSHYATETVEPGADMELKITGAKGTSVSVSVSSTNENGSAKTYNQMYQDAAKAINAQSDLGVRASVSNVDGKVSLVLTAKNTGEANGFTVTGSAGAADGIENAALAAQDAVFTVTENGYSQTYSSSTNNVSLDYGRIDAQIRGTGETKVYTGVDEDEVVSAVKNLMDRYNSVTSILEGNSGRGTGAAAHLAAFKRGMADEKTLKAIGITYGEDGRMQLDEDKLKEALEKDYEWTKETLGGQFGIAERAASRADTALSDSVQSIVNKDLSSATSESQSGSAADFKSSGFQYFNHFARSGAFNLSNYYAVGMLLNTMA